VLRPSGRLRRDAPLPQQCVAPGQRFDGGGEQQRVALGDQRLVLLDEAPRAALVVMAA